MGYYLATGGRYVSTTYLFYKIRGTNSASFTVALGIGFEPAQLYAGGIKEPAIEPGKPTIGIVHITFETTFLFRIEGR